MRNYILILITSFLFGISCQMHENDLDLIIEQDQTLLSFYSGQAVTDYLAQVENLSLDELILFEEARSFMSLQRKTEMIMDKLAETEFTSPQDLEEFVNKHSAYVKIVEEDGEKTIVRATEETTSHLLANVNGLFVIEEDRYKLFNEGLISVPVSQAEKLNEIIQFSKTVKEGVSVVYEYDNSTTPSTEAITCNKYNRITDTSYNNRTTTELDTKINYTPVPWRQTLVVQSQVFAERKIFGVWKPTKRSVTGFFKWTVWYNVNLGPKINVSRTSYRPVGINTYRWINKTTLATTLNGAIFYQSRFENLWAWGDSPSTGTRYLSCNAEETCADGNCEGPAGNRCAWVECPEGKFCRGGQCIPIPVDPCFGVICPRGKVCINGTCQDDPTICGVFICDGICVDGVCLANEQ
ncbi:hypothetical protein [Ekhidna sp.]